MLTMLVDLMHLARREGVDIATWLTHADAHYAAEIAAVSACSDRPREQQPVTPAMDAAVTVLREFVEDINSTGGLLGDANAINHAPAASDDWPDLGVTYLKACTALGVLPRYYTHKQPTTTRLGTRRRTDDARVSLSCNDMPLLR